MHAFPFNVVTDTFPCDFWNTSYHNVSGRPDAEPTMLTATTLKVVDYLWHTGHDCGWITAGYCSLEDNRAGRNGAQWNRYTTHDGISVIYFNVLNGEDLVTVSYTNGGTGSGWMLSRVDN